jgi:RNA polymerase sigma-70 factor, ECF subfamily
MSTSGLAHDTGIDIALLGRAARRDQTAIAALYDRHSSLLYSLILKILHQHCDAEDVLQEVFLRVWQRADTYNPTFGSPTSWLVRIARNRAIDRLRSRRAREAPAAAFGSPAVVDPVDNPQPAGDPIVRSERERAIARALGRLDQDQRTLIEQAFFLGYTHAELAERLQIPLGTVKTRIRTGLLALRKELQHAAMNL